MPYPNPPVRLLSNTGMDISMEIHEENVPKLKNSMNSYILQIDGTTDSEFDIIIVDFKFLHQAH